MKLNSIFVMGILMFGGGCTGWLHPNSDESFVDFLTCHSPISCEEYCADGYREFAVKTVVYGTIPADENRAIVSDCWCNATEEDIENLKREMENFEKEEAKLTPAPIPSQE